MSDNEDEPLSEEQLPSVLFEVPLAGHRRHRNQSSNASHILTIHKACRGLLLRLPTEPLSDGNLSQEHAKHFNDIKSNLGDIRGCLVGNNPWRKANLDTALPAICTYLALILLERPDWAAQMLMALADASRDIPFWRHWFGLREHTEESNLESEPDCVLEIARRVIVDSLAYTSVHVRAALRIIANCCADNNINRSLILQRNGIGALLRLAGSSVEMNVTIPALYNVCVDYDRPAVSEDGVPLRPTVAVTDVKSDTVTATEQALGKWDDDVCGTTTNMLLDLLEHGDVEYLEILAEVIEMSAKPVVFGINQVFGPCRDEKFERQCNDLFNAMTQYGAEIAANCPEARAHLSRVVVAFLSQPEPLSLMFNCEAEDILWKFFFGIPYSDDYGLGELLGMEEASDREALLKTLYYVCEATAFEKYDISDHSIRRILSDLHHCNEITENDLQEHTQGSVFVNVYPERVASAFVVLAAITTSKDRAISILETNILAPLHFFITNHEVDIVTASAIQLSIRLSLSDQGAAQLFTYGLVPSVLSLLTSRKPSLEVQREAVHLLRIIMRGNLERASRLLEDRVLHTLREVFDKTIDGSMKLEIGQFMVEFCRILRVAATKNELQSQMLHFWLGDNHLFDEVGIIEPVTFLFTDGQAPIQQEEALLGLAIISRQPFAACEMPLRKCIRDPRVLEKILEIGKVEKGPSWDHLVLIFMAIERTPLSELPLERLSELVEMTKKMDLQLVYE